MKIIPKKWNIEPNENCWFALNNDTHINSSGNTLVEIKDKNDHRIPGKQGKLFPLVQILFWTWLNTGT